MSSSHQTLPASSPGVGEQLRDARMEAGLTVAEAATRLRMQIRVVEALEAGNWARLGAPVFVRGQLRSYLRLLQLPQSLADTVPDAVSAEPPALTPRTYTPPMQRMLDKAMGRAVYVVITALIAVPVWVATRTHVDDRRPAEIASLGLGDAEVGQAQRSVRPTPVTASLGAMPKRNRAEPAPEEVGPTAGSELLLRFSGDSWLEVIGHDGKQLEQTLVRAGQERRFAVGSVARVKLGNASAVDVLHDGNVQDLSRFQRANVARFAVSSDGALAPVSE
ncbi:helix-turn-helix domain-containing protein [Luteimonas sp. 100069]|uniref:helix-turn-helix domain-containing protein n=1 Tax=Luteimonas sp. 100069 TaxID=2006109 RepID=UPI000F4E8141|nr:helix-turn-helix domain-containing protein [Luteimonas sp. 100069]RPD88706.1 helix-turn-helix domain-containing protein [Luteimonas sp. 100069]